MKRLLFLDFDGVLHPVAKKPGESLPFEWVPELTALLSEAPDAVISEPTARSLGENWAVHAE
jgi:trehalose-6-phosphatase